MTGDARRGQSCGCTVDSDRPCPYCWDEASKPLVEITPELELRCCFAEMADRMARWHR